MLWYPKGAKHVKLPKSVVDFANNLASIQWGLYIFLGGAVYGIILSAVIIDYDLRPVEFSQEENAAIVANNVTSTIRDSIVAKNIGSTIWKIVFSLIGIGAVPFILALALTRYHPERKLVPPFFIQLVGAAIMGLFAYLLAYRELANNPNAISLVYVTAIVLLPVGHFQD